MTKIEKVLLLVVLFTVIACGVPKVAEFLKGQKFHCKIEVTLPDGSYLKDDEQIHGFYTGYFGPREKVVVDANFLECQ